MPPRQPTKPGVDAGFSFAYVADSVGRSILAAQHCGSYEIGPSADWYVVQCHPGCDFLVRSLLFPETLEFAGIDLPIKAFLPLYVRRHPRDGALIDSLFPGYLFVAFDAGDPRWARLCGVRGVRLVLGGHYRPIPVSTRFVTALISLSGERGFEDRDGVLPQIAAELAPMPIGERVNATLPDGRQVESVVEWSDAKRVRLVLSMLGAERRVIVARSSVRTVEPKPKPEGVDQ